jgi:hypothetical protein
MERRDDWLRAALGGMKRVRTGRGNHAVLAGLLLALVGAAVGCGKDEATYTIGGTITGLSGSGLILSMPGQVVAVAQGATIFRFARDVPDGMAYDVKVALQPTVGTCSVSGGAGRVVGADASVTVACTGTMGWVLAAPMETARTWGSFGMLPSNEVLAAGGTTNAPGHFVTETATARTERWSAATGAWEGAGAHRSNEEATRRARRHPAHEW